MMALAVSPSLDGFSSPSLHMMALAAPPSLDDFGHLPHIMALTASLSNDGFRGLSSHASFSGLSPLLWLG